MTVNEIGQHFSPLSRILDFGDSTDRRDANGVGFVKVHLGGLDLGFAWANPEFASHAVPEVTIPDGWVWAQLTEDAPYRLWRIDR